MQNFCFCCRTIEQVWNTDWNVQSANYSFYCSFTSSMTMCNYNMIKKFLLHYVACRQYYGPMWGFLCLKMRQIMKNRNTRGIRGTPLVFPSVWKQSYLNNFLYLYKGHFPLMLFNVCSKFHFKFLHFINKLHSIKIIRQPSL